MVLKQITSLPLTQPIQQQKSTFSNGKEHTNTVNCPLQNAAMLPLEKKTWKKGQRLPHCY